MAILREEIIEALHAGTKEASRLYEKWSEGWTLKESGVEGLLVVEIARKLYKKLEKTPESLLFEVPFKKIVEWSDASQVGRTLGTLRGAKRPDIVLFNGKGKPTCVIEVKRHVVGEAQLAKDLDRLRDVVSKCANQKGGTLKRGFLVIYRQGRTKNLDKWISDYFKEDDNRKVRCHSREMRRFGSEPDRASVHVELTSRN